MLFVVFLPRSTQERLQEVFAVLRCKGSNLGKQEKENVFELLRTTGTVTFF